ncbi:MAG: hypothetical protein ACYSRP_03340 [Planctomycetota bacterium]|jgi:hypothetical protein
MKTVHKVKVPFTCRFRRWYKQDEGERERERDWRNVSADDPICIVAYILPPGDTGDIEAGADGWLEIEKWIKGGDELKIGTVIAKIHLRIPI